MNKWLPGFLLLLGASSSAESMAEREIVEVFHAYAEAWLANDETVPQRVMSLFSEDAVIMPHHGDPMRRGRDAISEFWFPGGEVVGTVSRFDQDVMGVEADGNFAWIYGRFILEFSYQGRTTSNEGNQLAVLRRQDGSWKIAALIWNDPPPRE